MSELVPRNEQTQLATAGKIANEHARHAVFADYLQRKSENTLKRHRRDLECFTEFLAGAGLELDPAALQTNPDAWEGISWGIVKAFPQWLLNEGYAVNTVNARLSAVRIYAGLAFDAGMVPEQEHIRIQRVTGYSSKEQRRINKKRDVTRVGDKKAKPTRVTVRVAARLKEQPETAQGWRDRVLMCLLLDHGLRVSEVASLRMDDVDLDYGELRITRHKVGKVQLHALTPDTEDALLEYMEHVRAPEDAGFDAPLLVGFFKGGKMRERAMSVRGIRKVVRELGEEAGIEKLSPHDCRHFWATDAARNGTDPFALKQAGGWASMATVARYIDESRIANEGVKLSSERRARGTR